MVIYADVGGTNTRVWTQGKGRADELVVGMRGIWTSAEKKRLANKLRTLSPKVTVLSDIELHQKLAFQKKPGIVLNAGTGSIAFGRNAQGKTARAGGLGPLIGDDGSAFWIGREYLRLRQQIEGKIDSVRPFATGSNAVAKIAGVSKKVLRIAEKQPHSYERRIVQEALIHLNDLVKEVRMKLKLPRKTPIHLTGGLFENKFFKDRWRKFQSHP